MTGKPGSPGSLLDVASWVSYYAVPVNLKDRDAFHLTIEEYLQSLISLIEELVCRPISRDVSITAQTS